MQLIFPTQTYFFHQRKTSTYSPQNVDKILLQCKTSTYGPQNVDKILLQCKTSTYGPQNVEEILHQRKTSTHGPQNVDKILHQQHTKKGSPNGCPPYNCREDISCSSSEGPQLRSPSPPKLLRS